MLIAINRWWYRRYQLRVARLAILSCGLKLSKSTYTCTICKGKILHIEALGDGHITYSGEVFAEYKPIACTCLRCRWAMNGLATECDDRQHPSLERFLLEHGAAPQLMKRFATNNRNIKQLTV